ncbi:LOW QUALITY PROTEIN: H-2 class I histocompatibility antigen, alpha chain-like [Vanacampus margaritifer]
MARKRKPSRAGWRKSPWTTPDYRETETQRNVANERVFQVNVGIARKRFNRTGDKMAPKQRFGLNKTPQISSTFPMKSHSLVHVVAFCAELPLVFLLQKTPSSPVTCHAAAFYPKTADLFWRKDGEQLHEDEDYGQTLPKRDGTFQMTVHMKVEVTAEVECRYECGIQLAGVKDQIVAKLERKNLLSNARNEGEKQKKIITVAAPLAAIGLAVVIAVIIVVVRHRNGANGAGVALS